MAVSLARHGPRLAWAYISGGAVWLAWSLARRVFYGVPFDPLPPDWPFFVAMAVMFPLAAWILVSVVIYAYLALAGGVMRRDEM